MKAFITRSLGLCTHAPLFLLLCFFVLLAPPLHAQNVGIGTTTPAAKLHIVGSADTSQLIIDGNSTQSNSNPLIKLRNSSGSDLMWIHSDLASNTFIGLNTGAVNNGGNFNTFIGSGVGSYNTIGVYNTANGAYSLYLNTSASQN